MTSASTPTTLLHLPLDLRYAILQALPLSDAINFCHALPNRYHSRLLRLRIARLRPIRDAWVRTTPSKRALREHPHLCTQAQRASLSPASFSRLRVLHCNTPITNISAISELRHLRFLDLSFCRLRAVPQQLRHCTQLRFLNLSHNKLVAFPDVVLQLPRLETLLLHFNSIPHLPSDWRNVPYLHRLGLHGCGVRRPLPDQLCRILGTYTEQSTTRSANLRGHCLDHATILALFTAFPNLSTSLLV